MTTLYVFDDGATHELWFSRPAVAVLAGCGRFDVVIGMCRNDAWIYEDLERAGARTVRAEVESGPLGAPWSLDYLRPPGALAVRARLRTYEDTCAPQWPNAVEVLRRELHRHGLAWPADAAPKTVPMPLPAMGPPSTPGPRPRIYVELDRGQDGDCVFAFDLERLSAVFPGWDFVCTRRPEARRPNLVDASGTGLAERARLSEGCDVLLGTTPYPFACTWTEANRHKPRAVCGYDARTFDVPWRLPGDPLEVLADMDEVVDFLAAVLWDRLEGNRAG